MEEIFRLDLTNNELRFIVACLCLGSAVKSLDKTDMTEATEMVFNDSITEPEALALINKIDKLTLHLVK